MQREYADQVQMMVRETCYFASNYEDELRQLGTPSTLAANTAIVQFPYTEAVSLVDGHGTQDDQKLTLRKVVIEKSEAELSAAADKRRENGRRLQEMQSKQRAQKVRPLYVGMDRADSHQLAATMVELEEYKTILSERASLKRVDFLASIVENTPFETEAELESWVKKTETDIRRKQKRDTGEEEPEEEPTFPLVEIPDTDLNEDEIKEKRRQRLMKAGWEARVKVREEKRKEKERLEEIKRKEEEFRETDPIGWAANLRAEQEVSSRMFCLPLILGSMG